jgi:uracil-DNA glycosylase family 4
VGRSGEELDRFLDTYGIDPDSCFITNIGRVFRIGNPDPLPDDITMWEPLLHEELNAARPIWIAAVGRISTRYFLGDVDMEAVHGIPFAVNLPWLDNGRGGKVVVIPIYHPAAGFHSTELQANIAYDFAQLAATLDGRLTPRDPELADRYPDPIYLDLTDGGGDLDLIRSELAGGSRNHPLDVAIDTEGLPGSPWGLSFSTEPGTAFVIRKVNGLALRIFYNCLIAGIKDGRLHIILHNSLHDLRVLRELGIRIPDGSFTDTMVLAYHLCIEPQGLKPLAFRHAGMLMDSYDEIVQDAQDRIAVEYYETIEGLTEGGVEYEDDPDDPLYEIPARVGPFRYIESYTILERDKGTGQLKERTKQPHQIDRRVKSALKELRASKITAANLRKRWADTDELVVAVVEEIIGPMREADLNDVPLDRAIRYAARDADATKRITPILRERHAAMRLEKVGDIDHAIIPMVDKMQAVGIPVDRDYFIWLSTDLARRMIEVQQKIKSEFGVWMNPNSGDQVADILFRPEEEGGYGLQASKQTKGTVDKDTGEIKKRRGSTQDKVLEGIRALHPIIPMILEYRGLMKAKTSFCDTVIRKAVWEQVDGVGMWVIHCNFRITRVSSGRLSATGPNLMAVVGGELGFEIRIGYIAGSGYEFVEWDLNQIEMRGMASEANDEFLISMFMADEDVHTGTADRMFKFGLTRPYNKKQVNKEKRDAAKRTGFGIITGIQPPGLVDQMRLQGIIVSEEEAASWIETWLAACPSVPEYMHKCHREAMAYGYVRDWSGRIRYLPGIHSPFRHVRAEAGRQSHSHKIQAGAQSIMKVGMATIWREVLPYWWARGKFIAPILQVHDSIMFRRKGFSEEEKVEMDAQIRAALFAAAPPGYRVPLDAGSGSAVNWGELDH